MVSALRMILVLTLEANASEVSWCPASFHLLGSRGQPQDVNNDLSQVRLSFLEIREKVIRV